MFSHAKGLQTGDAAELKSLPGVSFWARKCWDSGGHSPQVSLWPDAPAQNGLLGQQKPEVLAAVTLEVCGHGSPGGAKQRSLDPARGLELGDCCSTVSFSRTHTHLFHLLISAGPQYLRGRSRSQRGYRDPRIMESAGLVHQRPPESTGAVLKRAPRFSKTGRVLQKASLLRWPDCGSGHVWEVQIGTQAGLALGQIHGF